MLLAEHVHKNGQHERRNTLLCQASLRPPLLPLLLRLLLLLLLLLLLIVMLGTPEMTTVMKMPNGATLAAFLLSSAILPDAS
jgi:hypothetical protein